ncbi:hypothetical protein B9Z55_017161 [Caenorhabditis nigoni]|uniref:DUF38 domain-containing protein n=1 Tax=Caenorhabditis nigoni TaxID=1611254 RepID=A0A2G5T876_9PELO|nr:hypothetical protein B9Z55_017161 [Caenorhabditis nigoni]
MPFAYDWFAEEQKAHIVELLLHAVDDKIFFLLAGKGIDHEIKYERNGRFTLVKCQQNELLVPQHFSDVFREDFKAVMMNQKICLNLFHIYSEVSSAANNFLGIEDILKTRTAALPVTEILFSQITVSQGMSMIPYLNSFELCKLDFFFPLEPVSFEEFSNGFRNLKEGYRFLLSVAVKTIGKHDLMEINELSSISAIRQSLIIHSEFLRDQDECSSILSNKFDLEKDLRWYITFKTPILMKTPIKDETPIITGVNENAAQSVLENPLPMEIILKQLECFDM